MLVSIHNPDLPARTNDQMAAIRNLIGSGGFVRLNAAHADLIVKECRFERQNRDLLTAGDHHIKVLCDLMRRDQWRPKEKLDFALLGDRLIILNGHHRLGAQAQSGKRIEWVIVVHKCHSIDEVAALYYSFDTNIRPRTSTQILGGSDFAEKMGIPRTLTQAIWNAVPLLVANFDFKRTARDPLFTKVIDTRLDAVRSYRDEAVLWAGSLEGCSSKILKRRLLTQGSVAVALTTFRYQKQKAHEFWSAVASNDGLAKHTPENTYVAELLSREATGTASITARVAATAWNAFFQGRRLGLIRVFETRPIYIAGTPIGK